MSADVNGTGMKALQLLTVLVMTCSQALCSAHIINRCVLYCFRLFTADLIIAAEKAVAISL